MREVAVYPYTDALGTLAYEVVRFEPKAFRQRRANGEWNLHGVPRYPYRLPELMAALLTGQTVFIVEGEKDVETLRTHGFVATCNSGGAGQWRPEFAGIFLAGPGDVIVIPDNDPPGRAHAADVASSIVRARILELPALAKDATEWIESGGTIDPTAAVPREVWFGQEVTAKCKQHSPGLWRLGLERDAAAAVGDCPFGWAEALRHWCKSVPRWSAEESYAFVACQNARERLARATKGERDPTLGREALGLGNQVGAGRLELARACLSLFEGAALCGLVHDEGADRIKGKVLRALWRGMAEPAGPLRQQPSERAAYTSRCLLALTKRLDDIADHPRARENSP
jgi:hypothetical protein